MPFPVGRGFVPGIFPPGAGFTCGAAVEALGNASGVIVGGSVVAGGVAAVWVGGDAVAVAVATGFFVGSLFVPRMPRYTLSAATIRMSGAAIASSGILLFDRTGGGNDIAGGRIESGTRMPAAFVIDARTPLDIAPCASRAASS